MASHEQRPHHPDHEHNYEVDLPAIVPDIDIDDNTHGHVVYPTHPKTSTATLTEAQSEKQVRESDAEKGTQEYEIVDWDDDDPHNPRNFPKLKKWRAFTSLKANLLRIFTVMSRAITISVSSLCLCVALGSAIITGDLPGPQEDLHMSEIVGNLAVTLFVVGFGVGPLIYAPMSEVFGRRPIYMISIGLYFLFTLPSALAKNIATLLVGRALAGLAASAPMTNVGGTVADIWNIEDRGTPMAVFSAVIFIGPVLGPLIGGFVGETVGWRWIYWVLFIFIGCVWITTLFVPETFAVVLLRRRAQRLRNETGNPAYMSGSEVAEAGVTFGNRMKTALIRPFQMLFTEPILIFMSIYLSLIYMLLYLFFFAYPIVFEGLHGFDAGDTGLCFLSILVGILIAMGSMQWFNRLYARLAPKWGPEARLPPMMAGCAMLPISLFIFAWTSYEDVSWVGPMMSGIPFGWSMVSIYISANAYIVDSFPKYVASAMAAKTFARSMAGAAVPMFVIQMYDKLNPRWASTLLACVSCVMMPIPYVFMFYGKRIRAASRRSSE